jgi:hypothetical protein
MVDGNVAEMYVSFGLVDYLTVEASSKRWLSLDSQNVRRKVVAFSKEVDPAEFRRPEHIECVPSGQVSKKFAGFTTFPFKL